MRVLCIFRTNLTLGIRTKDLHSIVRSRRPVVVPIECPQPKTMAPTGPQTESLRTVTVTLDTSKYCSDLHTSLTSYFSVAWPDLQKNLRKLSYLAFLLGVLTLLVLLRLQHCQCFKVNHFKPSDAMTVLGLSVWRAVRGHGFWSGGTTTGLLLRTTLCKSSVLMPRVKFDEK